MRTWTSLVNLTLVSSSRNRIQEEFFLKVEDKLRMMSTMPWMNFWVDGNISHKTWNSITLLIAMSVYHKKGYCDLAAVLSNKDMFLWLMVARNVNKNSSTSSLIKTRSSLALKEGCWPWNTQAALWRLTQPGSNSSSCGGEPHWWLLSQDWQLRSTYWGSRGRILQSPSLSDRLWRSSTVGTACRHIHRKIRHLHKHWLTALLRRRLPSQEVMSPRHKAIEHILADSGHTVKWLSLLRSEWKTTTKLYLNKLLWQPYIPFFLLFTRVDSPHLHYGTKPPLRTVIELNYSPDVGRHLSQDNIR